MTDNHSEPNFRTKDHPVSGEASGGGDLQQQSPQPSYRDIELRRSIPPVVRRHIEQVPRMPGVPARDYFELFVCFAEATEAKSVFEYWWVLDLTVATLEISSYRRMKPLVIERSRRSHAQILADQDHGGQSLTDLSTEAQRKTQQSYDDAVDEAEAFLGAIHSLSHIDQLIDRATRRRNEALRDIERYQLKFAEKLRVVSGAVIDGKIAPKTSES